MPNPTPLPAYVGLLAGLALASLLPHALSAQSDVRAAVPGEHWSGLDAPTAAIEASDDWRSLAELLTRVAGSRPLGNAQALEDLRNAALIRHALGEPREAMNLMLQAAENALAAGRLMTAAHSYLDGAWIAQELELDERVEELARRALLLSESPYLSEQDRRAIRHRIATAAPTLLAES